MIVVNAVTRIYFRGVLGDDQQCSGNFLFMVPPIAARGSGGALKLPQQVRAEPGRQTHSDAF